MTFSEFRDSAITSAELYYKYLEDHGKGLATTEVRNFEILGNGFVKLFLFGRLASTDDIQIKILNKTYSTDQIKPVRYDKDERSLLVRPRDSLRNLFLDISPKDILVIADLKFLVKRVGNWYKTRTTPFGLPASGPDISSTLIPEASFGTPSLEQAAALDEIFQNPLTYIWGAPGTGKTQFVLARAVLAYCLAGKKVLITAPTNNAVEQTLKGVLSVLNEARIPLEKVIRLGTPSKEFYDQYPMVCEIRAVEDELEQLDAQLSHYKKFLTYHDTLQWYIHTDAVLSATSQKLSDLDAEYFKLEETLRQADSHHKAMSARFAPVLTQIEQLQARRNNLSSFINTKRSRASKWLHRKRLEQASLDLASVANRLAELGTEYERLLAEVDNLQVQIDALRGHQENTIKEKTKVLSDLRSLPPCPIRSGFSLIFSNLSADGKYKPLLSSAQAALNEIKSTLDSRAGFYSNISPDEANEAISRIEQRKETLDAQSTAARLADCLVAASTVDGYISKLSDNEAFSPVHVFLDEAAYCSLIKCATLLSARVPLTLLGDHKQLPPVCEAPISFLKLPKNEAVCLWAQTALFVDEIFEKSLSALSFEYLNEAEPHFPYIKKSNLLHTFRFGEELALVLARFVYTADFHGNPAIGTSIYYIDVPKSANTGKKKHQNDAECMAIRNLLQTASFSNYAVLTAYRAQRELLTQYVPPDDVFTIHGSQGREWDSVIISVVETTQHWFLSPVLINTAVSRAKKRLIIVCDAGYWKWQENHHIICGLMSAAEPYPEKQTAAPEGGP